MRLNGWQRGLVLVTLLWLCPVAYYAVLGFPSEDRLFHEELLAREQPANDPRSEHCPTIPGFPDYEACNKRQSEINQKATVAAIKSVEEAHAQVEEIKIGVQAKFIAAVAAIWIGPALVLYALGFGVAWVRRGFQKE